ncbi:MAG: hypothetical protein ABFC18_03420 [Rikenellaceae bacterium]
MKTQIKESEFSCDGENYYKGFSLGEKWNGFEVPYFRYDEAVKILEDSKKNELINSYSFNLTTKKFTVIDDYQTPEIIPMIYIDNKYAWSIGGFGWSWEDKNS